MCISEIRDEFIEFLFSNILNFPSEARSERDFKISKNGRGLFIRKFYDTKNVVITLITPCKLSLITTNKLLITP